MIQISTLNTGLEVNFLNAKIILLYKQADHTYEYAQKENQLNCYTIEMVANKQDKFFGIITRILEINKNIMCIVNRFENVPTNFESLSPLNKNQL